MLIKFSDIKGIEFACQHCNTRILYPLTQPYNRIVRNCPGCEEQIVDTGPGLHPSLPQPNAQIAGVMGELRKLIERPELHADVRLEIKNPLDS
jgi:hypothetical protein